MTDIEKVIKGLENCSTTDGNCRWKDHPDCPYIDNCKKKDYSALSRDALEVIKKLYRSNNQNEETIKVLCSIIDTHQEREEKLINTIKEIIIEKKERNVFDLFKNIKLF